MNCIVYLFAAILETVRSVRIPSLQSPSINATFFFRFKGSLTLNVFFSEDPSKEEVESLLVGGD